LNEARTALSIDPRNAEAYQFLGLALYSNGQYRAATHAYAESLAHDRDNHEDDNADTHYDMGIALHADHNLAGAIAAYLMESGRGHELNLLKGAKLELELERALYLVKE